MLLDIEDVELAGTIDHVTLAEMNTVTGLAGLDLLQGKTGTQCVQIHSQVGETLKRGKCSHSN